MLAVMAFPEDVSFSEVYANNITHRDTNNVCGCWNVFWNSAWRSSNRVMLHLSGYNGQHHLGEINDTSAIAGRYERAHVELVFALVAILKHSGCKLLFSQLISSVTMQIANFLSNCAKSLKTKGFKEQIANFFLNIRFIMAYCGIRYEQIWRKTQC